MRVPGLKTAKLAGRWLRGRLSEGVAILGYHRVADRSEDPFGLCIGRRHFAEQMEILGRETRPLSLQELARRLRSGELPRRAVVVTFDDGYADNLHQALPELERHEVPATVFVASGCLGGRFWWDELAGILPASPGRRGEMWRAFERELGPTVAPASAGSRKHALRAVARHLEGLGGERRQDLLRRLREWAAPKAAVDDTDRALNEDELVRLAAGGLVDVGGHTASHVALAGQTAAEQRAEIVGGKRALERLLGREVRSFAYPNGSIGSATPGLVREAGFACACGGGGGLASKRSDPYRLPRFWIGDWDGERFSRWLDRWALRRP